MTKNQIKQELAQLKSSARDIEELSKIQQAIDLTRELQEGSIWVISAKCDKIFNELINIKYGEENEKE